MFQIKNIQNTIIITDSITESYVKILLNLGRGLQELILDDKQIIKDLNFETPTYNINISSSSDENYFQLYTPNKINTIAIESMTGPANSFNNKFGLKVLKPNGTYQLN